VQQPLSTKKIRVLPQMDVKAPEKTIFLDSKERPAGSPLMALEK
jgi:hypothetical protein